MIIEEITEEPLHGVTLVYGTGGVGKSTLALEALQGRSIYISSAKNFSPERLLVLRSDAQQIIEKLVVFQPADLIALERAVNQAVKLSAVSQVLVIDSLATLIRQADRKMGNLALHRILTALKDVQCTVVLTSDVYDRVSGAPDSPFVGGDMLRLAADTIIELKDGVITVKKHALHTGRAWNYVIKKEGLQKA